MKWFQHDSDASTDAKIRKLILRHGTDGYAVYFHCIELIAGAITDKNITFELEHDAEIIADNLKVKGDNDFSAIDKVNRIMKDVINLGLFEMLDNKIICYKLALRLDNTVSRNMEMKKVQTVIKSKLKLVDAIITDQQRSNNVATTKEKQTCNVSDDITLDKITLKDNKDNINTEKKPKTKKDPKHKYGEYNNVLLTDKELSKLKEKFGDNGTVDWIKKLDEGIALKGYPYKSHYMAILKWNDNQKDSKKPEEKIDYSKGWET